MVGIRPDTPMGLAQALAEAVTDLAGRIIISPVTQAPYRCAFAIP
jgi:hypothetical protein